MKTTQLGIIQKEISTFKEKEEVHIIAKVNGSQFQSGMGYLVTSLYPPFASVCIDSSFIQPNKEMDTLMELGEHPYPIYKGLYIGERKETNLWAVLNKNAEVYVLSVIKSFVFKQNKGYLVVIKREVDSEFFPFYQGTYVYEPFVVDSEDVRFEFESFIPSIKEAVNTF